MTNPVAYDFQEFADILRDLFPDEKYRIAEGSPGKYMYKDPGTYILKNNKSIEELGINCQLHIFFSE